MTPFERSALLIDLQLGLRRVPAETLRAMLKPREPGDLEPEKIAASAVLDFLERMRLGLSASSAATDPAGRIAGQAARLDRRDDRTSVQPREARCPRTGSPGSSHLIEGASDDELAEIVHQALDAMGDGEAAVAACVDWAAASALLVELRDAVLDRMDEPGPEPGLPPGVELPEEAPGAGDPELEGTAGADLTPPARGHPVRDVPPRADSPGRGRRRSPRPRQPDAARGAARRSPTTSWPCWAWSRSRARASRAGRDGWRRSPRPGGCGRTGSPSSGSPSWRSWRTGTATRATRADARPPTAPTSTARAQPIAEWKAMLADARRPWLVKLMAAIR